MAIRAYASGDTGAGIEFGGDRVGNGWDAATHGRFANIGSDADDSPLRLLTSRDVLSHIRHSPGYGEVYAG